MEPSAFESSRVRIFLVLLVAGAAVSIGSRVEPHFDPWTESATYELEYRVDLAPVANATRWRVWVPLPADTGAQRVIASAIEAPAPYSIAEDARGNRYVYVEGQGRPDAPLVTRFTVKREPYDGIPSAQARLESANDPSRFLGAQKRIPLEGLIAQISEQESRGVEGEGAKVRAFYDYVLKNMRYAKHGEGWGEGDAIWACTEKYGNCTDFHSLFIGLARHQSIPARFVIGFPLSPKTSGGEVDGYHCWAEVFQKDRGWLPLDVSEAWKSGRNDDYFGRLPSDRVEFTIGRDLTLEPPQAGPARNYMIYPYAEADGEPIERLPFEFRYERKQVDGPARG